MNKPCAPACLRNQAAIYAALNPMLQTAARVFEIGAGTAQHAAYFLARRPDLAWHCSDLPEQLPAMQAWLATLMANAAQQQARQDIRITPLDVTQRAAWPQADSADWTYMANTLHFVGESCAQAMLQCAAHVTRAQGSLAIYGPFREAGKAMGEGDAALDRWCRQRDPSSGIKSRDWLRQEAAEMGFVWQHTLALPANNYLIVMNKF